MADKYTVKITAEFSDKISEPVKKSQNSLEKLSKKLKETGKSMQDLGGTLSTNLTLPIVGFAAAALKVSGDMEALQADFTTLMGGNTEDAEKFTKALKEMGASTPFETMDLAKNSKLLLSFGIAQEKILPSLQMLGDIAGGNAEKLSSLSLVFAQVQSQGKLTGQDLMQMINAGFNPLQIMSKKTGKTISQLKDEMSKGAITSEMVAEAFKDATTEGGLFFKGMERGSKTLPGLISTLKDAFADLLLVFGDLLKDQLELSVMIPVLSKGIQDFAKNVKEWTAENPKMAKFITYLLLTVAAMGPLLFGVGKLVSAFGIMGVGLSKLIIFTKTFGKALIFMGKYGFKALQLLAIGLRAMAAAAIANPIILIIGAIILGAFLIYKYWKPIKKFFIDLFKKFKPWIAIIFGFIGVFAAVAYAIYKNWKPIKEFFGNLWDWISEKFESGIARVKEAINSVVKFLSFGLSKDVFEIKTAAVKGNINNINRNENASEITVKVEAEKGTTSTVQGVKNTKGSSNVRVSNKANLGRTVPAL